MPASQFNDRLINVLRQGERGIVAEIQNELRDQGHYNTGQLSKSIQGNTTQISDGGIIEIEMNDYHVFVEKGVRAGRIPFGGRSRGAKTSRYIQGLIAFFQNKGLSERDAKGAAFATARKHSDPKGPGMPTKNSYSKEFSANGRRLRFIEESTDVSKSIDELETQIQDLFELESNLILDHFENSIK